jgi:hypothetical protein
MINIDHICNKFKKYDLNINNKNNINNKLFIKNINKIHNLLNNNDIFKKLAIKLNNKFDLQKFYTKINILLGGYFEDEHECYICKQYFNDTNFEELSKNNPNDDEIKEYINLSKSDTDEDNKLVFPHRAIILPCNHNNICQYCIMGDSPYVWNCAHCSENIECVKMKDGDEDKILIQDMMIRIERLYRELENNYYRCADYNTEDAYDIKQKYETATYIINNIREKYRLTNTQRLPLVDRDDDRLRDDTDVMPQDRLRDDTELMAEDRLILLNARLDIVQNQLIGINQTAQRNILQLPLPQIFGQHRQQLVYIPNQRIHQNDTIPPPDRNNEIHFREKMNEIYDKTIEKILTDHEKSIKKMIEEEEKNKERNESILNEIKEKYKKEDEKISILIKKREENNKAYILLKHNLKMKEIKRKNKEREESVKLEEIKKNTVFQKFKTRHDDLHKQAQDYLNYRREQDATKHYDLNIPSSSHTSLQPPPSHTPLHPPHLHTQLLHTSLQPPPLHIPLPSHTPLSISLVNEETIYDILKKYEILNKEAELRKIISHNHFISSLFGNTFFYDYINILLTKDLVDISFYKLFEKNIIYFENIIFRIIIYVFNSLLVEHKYIYNLFKNKKIVIEIIFNLSKLNKKYDYVIIDYINSIIELLSNIYTLSIKSILRLEDLHYLNIYYISNFKNKTDELMLKIKSDGIKLLEYKKFMKLLIDKFDEKVEVEEVEEVEKVEEVGKVEEKVVEVGKVEEEKVEEVEEVKTSKDERTVEKVEVEKVVEEEVKTSKDERTVEKNSENNDLSNTDIINILSKYERKIKKILLTIETKENNNIEKIEGIITQFKDFISDIKLLLRQFFMEYNTKLDKVKQNQELYKNEIITQINTYTTKALQNSERGFIRSATIPAIRPAIRPATIQVHNNGGGKTFHFQFTPTDRTGVSCLESENNQELNFILYLYNSSDINSLINTIYETINSCNLHYNVVLDIYINFLNFIKIYCNLEKYEKIYLLILNKDEFTNIFIDILCNDNNSFIYLKKILCDSIFNIYPMILNKNINNILIYNLILINNIIKLYKFINKISLNFDL